MSKACFGPLIDPEAVRQLEAHTPGDTVTLDLGGKTDAGFGGGPITVMGTLKVLSDGAYTGTGPILGGLRRS